MTAVLTLSSSRKKGPSAIPSRIFIGATGMPLCRNIGISKAIVKDRLIKSKVLSIAFPVLTTQEWIGVHMLSPRELRDPLSKGAFSWSARYEVLSI